jgi:hypothetical protein
MSLLTPNSVSLEGAASLGEIVALDPFVCQDMRECANCGGRKLFQPVDRFPFGWRGYCLGCEETKYVMDERTSEEAA